MDALVLCAALLSASYQVPPLLGELTCFPSLGRCYRVIAWLDRRRAHLELMRDADVVDPEWWQQAIDAQEDVMRAWVLLRNARLDQKAGHDFGALHYLVFLRRLLSHDDYCGGAMPMPGPPSRLWAPWLR